MQKAPLLFSLTLLLICSTSQSQDNIYPLPSGPVGIGTTAPSVKLHVVSTNHMFSLENPDGATANQYSQMLLRAGSQNNYIWTNNQNSPDFYGGNGALNIYTGQASPIAFFTNATSTPRMVVASGGNVGIGTTNPAARLSFSNINDSDDPVGITWYNAAPTLYGIHRTAGTWTGPNYQQLRVGWSTGIVLDPGTLYGKCYVDIQGGGLRVTSGDVGIGTNSPLTPLEINGAVKTNHNGDEFVNYDGVVGIHSNGYAYQQGALNGFVFASNKNREEQIVLRSGSSSTPHLIDFYTNATHSMRIDSYGNVGIGTLSPQAKLAVNGDVFAKKMKVTQSGWPDYVFHSDYKLLPITELEKFIQENNHLPDVPSADEVEKHGLDIGENQAILLKKIEELTLYIIDFNKKAEEQHKLIQDQKQKIERQEQEIKKLAGRR